MLLAPLKFLIDAPRAVYYCLKCGLLVSKPRDGQVKPDDMAFSHQWSAEADDSVAVISRAWDLTHPYGLHYYCVGEFGGKMYVSFSQDVKLRNPKQCKGDIGFCTFTIPDEDRNKVANKSRKGNLSFCEIRL